MTAPPLMVVSPHLDDAVLGCAGLLAANRGARVVTVLAGSPPSGRPGPWDITCGFTSATDAMAARRAEDRSALAGLGASAEHLGLLDVEYRESSGADQGPAAVDALAAVLQRCRPPLVAVPLGLHHPDHVEVADAATEALGRAGVRRWVVYGDYYRRAHPEEVAPRLAALAAAGVELAPAPAPALARWRRARAVLAYRSQAPGIGRRVQWSMSGAPEQMWDATATGSPQ